MNGYWSIVVKEFTHLRRDRASLIIAILMPLIQLLLFGYAIDFDVRHIPTVIVDQDHSRESRQFVAQMQATQYMHVVAYAATEDEAAAQVRSGRAHIGITIPPDFARRVSSGDNPNVSVVVDGSDSQIAMRARMAFLQSPGAAKTVVAPKVNVLFNPDMRTAVFMIPALIAVVMQIVTLSLTAFSIVREREQGTLEQLMVSPVGRMGLMLGKLTPYACLAMVEMCGVLFAGWLVFGVPVNGSLALLVVLTLPFVMAALALGLVISTIARTQAQAMQFTMLITMPSILLSGYVSPRETQPGALYVLSTFIPATHFIAITRGIIVRAAGLMDLIPNVLALLAIGGVLVVIAAARFHKSFS